MLPAIIILTLIVYLLIPKKPRLPKVAFGKDGIKLNDRDLPYNLFRSYRVIPEQKVIRIELKPHARMRLPVILYLPTKNIKPIIAKLANRLPSDPKIQETIGDKLTKLV